MAHPYLGSSWGPRREPVEECARRLKESLTALTAHGEQLQHWYLGGRSGKPKRPLSITHDALVEQLLRGRNRNDVDHAFIEDLGYSVSAWNGTADENLAADMRVDCGAWTTAPGVMNHFNLTLPAVPTSLVELPTSLALLRIVVEAWEPDWAVVTTDGLRDAQERKVRVPYIGWLTYLSPGRGDPGPVRGAAIEHLPNGGSVVVLAPRLEDAEAADALRVAEALRIAGALSPTPLDRAVTESAAIR